VSRTPKKEKWLVTFAFLTICVVLIAIIFSYETWKFHGLKELKREVPEFVAPTLTQKILFQEKFDDTSLVNWQEEERSGFTEYSVEADADGNSYLRAESNSSSSLLIKKIKYNPKRFPYLRWRWKVEKMPPAVDMRLLYGSDAPARVYVAFPEGIGIWNTRLINYVWASSMPQGDVFHSFFSRNSQIVVLQSGMKEKGEWVTEVRNVLEDYRNLFGEDPPLVEAIAIMTDSDNSKGEAIAYYDNIVVSSQP